MPSLAPGGGGVVAVTGASGYLGSHVVQALLSNGFRVRAVVRDPSDAVKTAHLRALEGGTEGENLFFCAGDLLIPGSYDEAIAGADAVVHAAAVVEIDDPKDPQREVVDPSVEGTRNILASIDKAGSVKRLVHISSIAAVWNMDKEPSEFNFSEEDWNTWSSIANGDPYGFAKVSAERLVVDHITGASRPYDYATLNPCVMLGPCLCKAHTKTSAVIVRQFLYGNPQPDYFATFVDVRDVAAAACAALTVSDASNTRCILASDVKCRLLELEAPLKSACPEYKFEGKSKISGLTSFLGSLPLLGGLIMNPLQQRITRSDVRYSFHNARSKELLRVAYRPFEETLKDTVSSMVDTGYIKARKA